jgi:hypothetical protein
LDTFSGISSRSLQSTNRHAVIKNDHPSFLLFRAKKSLIVKALNFSNRGIGADFWFKFGAFTYSFQQLAV